LQLIYAFAHLKQGCATVNHGLGRLGEEKKNSIVQVCGEILSGQLDQEFPLSVWQTGSGTQTNMNLNEVIANRATLILTGTLSGTGAIHPNDDVNMSQSSNDTFPSAMHIATVVTLEETLLPVIIYNILQSVTLLSDAIHSFDEHCAAGIEPVREKIAQNLHQSLMLVTALNPHIGYENAARIAKEAHADNSTLKAAAIKLGLLTGKQFDTYMELDKMTGSTD